MKKVISITLLIMLILILGISAYAHSGRTDASGGHYDNSTGDYHYHHGFSAHEHPGGKCPYKSGNSSSGNSIDFGTIIGIAFACLIIFLMLLPLWISIFDKIKEFFSSNKNENQTNDITPTQTQPSPSSDNITVSKTKDSDMFTFNSFNYSNRTTSSLNPQQSPDNEELIRLKKQISKLKIENSKLNAELTSVKEELSKEKQRTAVVIPHLQNQKSIPEYLKLPNENEYYEALESNRTEKVASGKIIIKQLAAKMYSEYSGKTYTTTLNNCTCEDFKFRKKPCKHMLAFALEINAITNEN